MSQTVSLPEDSYHKSTINPIKPTFSYGFLWFPMVSNQLFGNVYCSCFSQFTDRAQGQDLASRFPFLFN